jgi:SOS-response transcriptional repressor LexA
MLSDRQYAILGFIHQHIQDHGFVPSIREICRAVKINSTSVVNYNLNRLTARGYLMRTSGKARALVLTNRARELFEEQHTADFQELSEQIRLLRDENKQLRRHHQAQIATLRREYEDTLQELKQLRNAMMPYPG